MDVDCDDDDLPEFFKVYITIHSFNSMLIPREFKEFIGLSKSGPAELLVSGEKWRVELFDDGMDLCFTKGWREFVQGNLIKEGDFMFFKFHGNLIFSVVIYDESMCEKEIGKSDGCGKDCIQEGKEMRSVLRSKEKAEPSSPSETKRKTTKRAVKTKPFFEKSINGYNMNFPMEFVKENSLNYKSNEKMILRTSRSASWEINIIDNRGVIVMSGGWVAFIRESNINVGDICKFELIDRLEMMVRVTRRAYTPKKVSGKRGKCG